MVEIQITDKQKYLDFKYPFSSVPLLTEKRHCLLCSTNFLVEHFKVFKASNGRELICCPNAPACKGTVTDWYKVE